MLRRQKMDDLFKIVEKPVEPVSLSDAQIERREKLRRDREWLAILENTKRVTTAVETITANIPPVKPVIDPLAQNLPVNAPILKAGRGRPKGSKNKSAPKHHQSLPVHDVNDDQECRCAVLDILWRRSHITEAQVIAQLNFVGKLQRPNAFAILKRMIEDKLIRVTALNAKKIRFLYPCGTRTGWYYKGQLRSIRELARLLDAPHNTILKRLNNGWSIEDLMTTPINKNQATKGNKKVTTPE